MGRYMNQNSTKKILKNTQVESLFDKRNITNQKSKNIFDSLLRVYEMDNNPNDLLQRLSNIENSFSAQKQLKNLENNHFLSITKQYFDSQIYLKKYATTIPLKKKSSTNFKMIKVGLEDASQKNWSIYTNAFDSGIALSRNVRVEMQPFYISQYPISTKMFLDIMGDNKATRKRYPEYFYDDTNKPPTFDNNPNRAVRGVQFIDALKFCNKLSKLHNLKEVYEIKWVSSSWEHGHEIRYDKFANGYKLPNILQWEYAMEGGLQEDIYFGTSEMKNRYLYYPNQAYRNDPSIDMYSIEMLPNRFGIYYLNEQELVNDLAESDSPHIYVNNIKYTCYDIEKDGMIDANGSMFNFVRNRLTEFRCYCSIGYNYRNGLQGIEKHERDDISREILMHGFRIIKNA